MGDTAHTTFDNTPGACSPVDLADGVVHIFSLASGLLYERFLRIMMASTRQRTERKLKFWLLGNFLSPSFREAVRSGRLAAAVGAEVEMVTYAWPRWLREQSEKQRLIWGYKILFLDVMFPLHLKKIIYIDADQVRTSTLLSRRHPPSPRLSRHLARRR